MQRQYVVSRMLAGMLMFCVWMLSGVEPALATIDRLEAVAGPVKCNSASKLCEVPQGGTATVRVHGFGVDACDRLEVTGSGVSASIAQRKAGLGSWLEVKIQVNSNASLGNRDIRIRYLVEVAGYDTFTVKVVSAGQVENVVPVSKSQRDLLVFIADLSKDSTKELKTLYDTIEAAAEAVATGALKDHYRKVHVVKGADATRAGFSDKLKTIAADSAVKAVDVIFVTHGLSQSVYFSDGGVGINRVKDDIVNKLSASHRAKLRVLFSTACYGSTHLSGWLQAGFKVASGSKLIYADSAVSFPVFVTSWSSGNTFAKVVADANKSDPLDAQDNIAKQVLKRNDVDSTRVISGKGDITIATLLQ